MYSQNPQTSESQRNMTMIKLLDHLIPPLEHERMNFSWNQNDSSANIYLHPENEFICMRICEERTTDCIRGKHGFTGGIHAWQIQWSQMDRGVYPIVGVATEDVLLYENGQKIVVGRTKDSWGWDLNSNYLYHNSVNREGTKYPNKDQFEKILIPETVTLLLNMEEGTLSYIINKAYLGIAFKGLRGLKLYPIINVTQHTAQITMKYLGGLTSEAIDGLVIV